MRCAKDVVDGFFEGSLCSDKGESPEGVGEWILILRAYYSIFRALMQALIHDTPVFIEKRI